MDMRLCYEAGAVLFWLLFAYLFMDKFLFRGQLGEICFGKARRRMAKALRGAFPKHISPSCPLNRNLSMNR